MRKSILSAVAGVTFLLGIAACSEENKYGHENEVYNSMPLLLWCKRLIMCGVLVNAEG